MRWRDISEGEVTSTLTHPENTEPSIKGRKIALKHIGHKWVKVTFMEEHG